MVSRSPLRLSFVCVTCSHGAEVLELVFVSLISEQVVGDIGWHYYFSASVKGEGLMTWSWRLTLHTLLYSTIVESENDIEG